MDTKILHFTDPGTEFEDGSPVGCGSAGAMILGDTECEKMWLTQESIWAGDVIETNANGFKEKAETLRKMWLDGNLKELDDTATELVEGSVYRIKSLEYAGLFKIDLGKGGGVSDYTRDLILNTGVLNVSFRKGSCKVTEQAFSSYSYEVTCVKYTFSEPRDITAALERENLLSTVFEDGILLSVGKTQTGGHGFTVGIKINTDGTAEYTDGKVKVSSATNVEFYISIASEYDFDDAHTDTVLDILSECTDYDEIYENHCEDFAALFERSDISFRSDAELEKLTIRERLARLKADDKADDPGLIGLYFAFGKYLLISSSREGTLPANLQGVWVEKLENPWNADYHTNINLQMNYWLAENTNLSECHLPLFDYMNDSLLESGIKTARDYYGCRGTVLHHVNDIYGFTAPADGLWGIWPMGGAWLSTHMWEHYLFTLDEEFLRTQAYGYMKACALFFIDYMFEDKNGRLLTGPSMSPENRYYIDTENGQQIVYLTCSPTMDIEIVTAVLRNYIDAENILDIDAETKAQAEKALAKLPPLQIGRYGQLMEWIEDYDEPEPGHRHISHAFGLYPDNMITEKTPELFGAIKKSLERRLSFGGGHTGWSRAWLINLFARLKDGEKAYENTRLLLTRSTRDSMLDSHPPFQIDGNFGGAAGIAEMLLQSHEGCISLLPAAVGIMSGSFTGLKARGNIEVNAEFENGTVVSFGLYADDEKTVSVKVPGAAAVTDGENDYTAVNGLFTLPVNGSYAVKR